MTLTLDWFEVAAFLGVIFGPGLYLMVRSMTGHRRAAKRAAAEHYSRRGYEALEPLSRGPRPRRSNPAIPPRIAAPAMIEKVHAEAVSTAVTDTMARPNPATPPSTATLVFPELWLCDRGDRR